MAIPLVQWAVTNPPIAPMIIMISGNISGNQSARRQRVSWSVIGAALPVLTPVGTDGYAVHALANGGSDRLPEVRVRRVNGCERETPRREVQPVLTPEDNGDNFH